MAALLVAEWLPISRYVGTGRGGGEIAAAAVPFLAFFFAFGFLRAHEAVAAISMRVKRVAVSWPLLLVHAACMLAFLALSALSMRLHVTAAASAALAAAWFGCGLGGIASAACAFLPPPHWFRFLRATGKVWAYSCAGAIAAWKLIPLVRSAWSEPHWRPLTNLTFRMVEILLRPFGPVTSYPMYLTIGTPKFMVRIADSCSGLEGVGLMLFFSAVWLWLFRRECRFPRALLLVPIGVAIIWVLNAVRIVALILIGHAGAPAIAFGGFHSQAGWISFNLVAIGVAVAAARVPWWRRGHGALEMQTSNPAASYLAPFLAILASAMLSRAASAGFEWLYPLRLFAAAAVFWAFRSQYRKMEWRCDWFAPAAGLVVYALWMGLEKPAAATGLPPVLTAAPAGARVAWLTARSLAAVITVPAAEELAFRGFLIRRTLSANFEARHPRSYSYLALLVSSLAFGLMHGERWIAGALAGFVYAAAWLRRGRIGDAVAAHATTNALIAATVLKFGKWYLW